VILSFGIIFLESHWIVFKANRSNIGLGKKKSKPWKEFLGRKSLFYQKKKFFYKKKHLKP